MKHIINQLPLVEEVKQRLLALPSPLSAQEAADALKMLKENQPHGLVRSSLEAMLLLSVKK